MEQKISTPKFTDLAEIIEAVLNDCITKLTSGRVKMYEGTRALEDMRCYLVSFLNVSNSKHMPEDIAGEVKEYVTSKKKINTTLGQFNLEEYAKAIKIVAEKEHENIKKAWNAFISNPHYKGR